MTQAVPSKPWPRDVIPIVCATPDEAKTENMESVHSGVCIDCFKPVVFDGKTFRHAKQMPERRGRLIVFMCIQCAITYSSRDIEFLVDHRKADASDAVKSLI